MLFGSSILPSMILIVDKEVQLGDVVRRAFADSGLTVEEWNNLPEHEREDSLARAISVMRFEAGQ